MVLHYIKEIGEIIISEDLEFFILFKVLKYMKEIFVYLYEVEMEPIFVQIKKYSISDNGKTISKWKGYFIFSDQKIKYEGKWKNGSRHGTGIEYNKEGEKILEGKWKTFMSYRIEKERKYRTIFYYNNF